MNPPIALSMEGTVPEITLGIRMRIARERAGIKVEEMADLLGYQRNAPARWETDKVVPRGAVLATYASLTGVSLHWLLTGEAPPPPDGGGGEPVKRPGGAKMPAGPKRRTSPTKANSRWNTTPAAAHRGTPSRRSSARPGVSPKGSVNRAAA